MLWQIDLYMNPSIAIQIQNLKLELPLRESIDNKLCGMKLNMYQFPMLPSSKC